MENKGLTISLIFEAESANYGEGFGNITTLKKLSRGDGNSYSYISRQALRYNIVEQMGINNTPVKAEGKGDNTVVQFESSASIEQYPEIDLFGYMKTKSKGENENAGSAKTRSAVVRLSNAIALESYNSDLDFLTNMGLAKRIEVNNNIAQSEIHKSYYTYTVTLDLNRVGVDGEINISNKEKANRIKSFLNTIKNLYRDIKGRRENLSPIFVIGGVYEIKNPYFENRLKINKNNLDIDTLLSVINNSEDTKNNTIVAKVGNIFSNSNEIKEKLSSIEIGEFFNDISKKVEDYYGN
jgi:CRISPR-associated protein Cst2